MEFDRHEKNPGSLRIKNRVEKKRAEILPKGASASLLECCGLVKRSEDSELN